MLLIAPIVFILIFVPLILIFLECRLLTTLKLQPFETILLSHNLFIERFVDTFVITLRILASWIKESRHWYCIRIQIFWVLFNARFVKHLYIRVTFFLIFGYKISAWWRELSFVMTCGGLVDSPICKIGVFSSCATLTYISIIYIAGWRPFNDFAFHFLTGANSMESWTRLSSWPKRHRWLEPVAKICCFTLLVMTIWLLRIGI